MSESGIYVIQYQHVKNRVIKRIRFLQNAVQILGVKTKTSQIGFFMSLNSPNLTMNEIIYNVSIVQYVP